MRFGSLNLIHAIQIDAEQEACNRELQALLNGHCSQNSVGYIRNTQPMQTPQLTVCTKETCCCVVVCMHPFRHIQFQVGDTNSWYASGADSCSSLSLCQPASRALEVTASENRSTCNNKGMVLAECASEWASHLCNTGSLLAARVEVVKRRKDNA